MHLGLPSQIGKQTQIAKMLPNAFSRRFERFSTTNQNAAFKNVAFALNLNVLNVD